MPWPSHEGIIVLSEDGRGGGDVLVYHFLFLFQTNAIGAVRWINISSFKVVRRFMPDPEGQVIWVTLFFASGLCSVGWRVNCLSYPGDRIYFCFTWQSLDVGSPLVWNCSALCFGKRGSYFLRSPEGWNAVELVFFCLSKTSLYRKKIALFSPCAGST